MARRFVNWRFGVSLALAAEVIKIHRPGAAFSVWLDALAVSGRPELVEGKRELKLDISLQSARDTWCPGV